MSSALQARGRVLSQDGDTREMFRDSHLCRLMEQSEIDDALRVITRATANSQDLVLHLNSPGTVQASGDLGEAQHMFTPDMVQFAARILSSPGVQSALLGSEEFHNTVSALVRDTAATYANPFASSSSSSSGATALRLEAETPRALSGSYVAVASDLSTSPATSTKPLQQSAVASQRPPQQPASAAQQQQPGSARCGAARLHIRARDAAQEGPAFQGLALLKQAGVSGGCRAGAAAALTPQERAFRQELGDYACALCRETVVGAHNCSCRCNGIFCGECLLTDLSKQAAQQCSAPNAPARGGPSCPSCRARVDSANGFGVIDAAVGRFVRAAPACASKERWVARGARWEQLNEHKWPQQVKQQLAALSAAPPHKFKFVHLAPPEVERPTPPPLRITIGTDDSSSADAAVEDDEAHNTAAHGEGGEERDGDGVPQERADWWTALPLPVQLKTRNVLVLCTLASAVVILMRMGRRF
ncbi:hypothetical protein JKP88DRAFT_329898 [Tribonema minus]|uniref:RING-type domain-containing protein n=1 Tax=Tribonema minus TaxID=303371 RepID=A0A835YR15_9STRA|nr:hypothetical protein JKP88DRAFT_329898 [Tribonema minus]